MTRLVAIDIDGTLLDGRGQVPAANLAALHDAAARGVRLVVVTGRSYPFAIPAVAGLPDPLTLVVYNGAVARQRGGDTIVRRTLDPAVAQRVLVHTRGWRVATTVQFDREPTPGKRCTTGCRGIIRIAAATTPRSSTTCRRSTISRRRCATPIRCRSRSTDQPPRCASFRPTAASPRASAGAYRTVIAVGTSRPWRSMTSSSVLIAFGSKLPDAMPSLKHEPDVPLQRPAVGRIVASRGLPRGEGHHDGVVQLEADRQLLQRLEHQRVEVPDRSEVEEPQHALAIDEDVPGMRDRRQVRPVADDLIEEGDQQPPRQRARRFTATPHSAVIGHGGPSISSMTRTRRVQRASRTSGADTPTSSPRRPSQSPRRLAAVVELALERPDELVGQPFHTILACRLDSPLEHAGHHAQHRGDRRLHESSIAGR